MRKSLNGENYQKFSNLLRDIKKQGPSDDRIIEITALLHSGMSNLEEKNETIESFKHFMPPKFRSVIDGYLVSVVLENVWKTCWLLISGKLTFLMWKLHDLRILGDLVLWI